MVMENCEFYLNLDSKYSHGYVGFRNCPEINFLWKIARILPRKWSWKIANLVLESHGKVTEFHFQGFVGTLPGQKWVQHSHRYSHQLSCMKSTKLHIVLCVGFFFHRRHHIAFFYLKLRFCVSDIHANQSSCLEIRKCLQKSLRTLRNSIPRNCAMQRHRRRTHCRPKKVSQTALPLNFSRKFVVFLHLWLVDL